jgi:dihydroxyacetone kinase
MTITAVEVKNAFKRSADALRANSEYLVELDQQLGDGDLGITARKIADTLDDYISQTQDEMDIGKWVMSAGMKINSAAPSTMGSLLAIALMRAGKTAKDQTEINENTLVEMLKTGTNAILEKGKANLGDKTILDALIPGVNAFADSIKNGEGLSNAGKIMLTATEAGMASVTPFRSKVGRASWVGDRTEGKVDPGCALWVCVLKGLIE